MSNKMSNSIICPYCGYEFSDSWEFEDLDGELINCQDCEKSFYVTRNVEITYSTKEAKYGTCRRCGTKNVILENVYATTGSSTVDVEDYCLNCIRKANDKLIKDVSIIDKKDDDIDDDDEDDFALFSAGLCGF